MKRFVCLETRREEGVGAYIEQLAMLVPVYVQGGGDMTKVVLNSGGSFVDPRPVPAVMKSIARYYGVDLTAVRERYGEILGRKLHVPLPLSPQLVLIPLKMRTPRVPKDGTTGYIATRCLERIHTGPGTTACRLDIQGAGRVECLQSYEFALQQWRNARIVQAFYKETMSPRMTYAHA